MEKLKQFLIDQGFTIYGNSLRAEHNVIDWYAGRRLKDANPCETNDHKVSLIIYPHEFGIDDRRFRSVECDITGEAKSIWFKLQAYSLKPEELIERLDEVEAGLLKAWNAVSE